MIAIPLGKSYVLEFDRFSNKNEQAKKKSERELLKLLRELILVEDGKISIYRRTNKVGDTYRMIMLDENNIPLTLRLGEKVRIEHVNRGRGWRQDIISFVKAEDLVKYFVEATHTSSSVIAYLKVRVEGRAFYHPKFEAIFRLRRKADVKVSFFETEVSICIKPKGKREEYHVGDFKAIMAYTKYGDSIIGLWVWDAIPLNKPYRETIRELNDLFWHKFKVDGRELEEGDKLIYRSKKTGFTFVDVSDYEIMHPLRAMGYVVLSDFVMEHFSLNEVQIRRSTYLEDKYKDDWYYSKYVKLPAYIIDDTKYLLTIVIGKNDREAKKLVDLIVRVGESGKSKEIDWILDELYFALDKRFKVCEYASL